MSKYEKVAPNSNNYMRGGARVFVRRTTEAASGGWLHLGNIVNVTVQPDVNVQEHVTGIDGRREVDRRFTDIRSITYQVQCDENVMENIRLWLHGGTMSSGSQSAVDLSSGAKKLSEVLRGISAYTDIVAGRWYDLSDGTANKPVIYNISKAYTPNNSYSSEHVQLGSRAQIENDTDAGFRIDYLGGKIMFYAAPAADHAVKLKATSLSGVQSFDKNYVVDLDVVAEGWYVFEDGEVVDKWTLPRARLEPAGNSAISIDNPKTIEFNLVQLKDSTDGWGTYTRFYPNYT